MATVGLTPRFSNLDRWPGDLFRAGDDTVVTARTATTFNFTYGASSDFAGYSVAVVGTGFTYVGGVPVGGTMTSVRILSPTGATVVNITGLSGALATDFDDFYANVFGSPSGDAGPGPDGQMAWNFLLSGNDTFYGTAGDDRQTLPGFNAGNDIFHMGGGDDQMGGSVGNDTYNGGSGWDTLTFRETAYNLGGTAVRGIVVNVAAGTVLDPWGGTDRFTGVEAFEGSRFADRFIGSAVRDDRFSGLRGSDTFNGGLVSVNASGQRTGDDSDDLSYDNDYWQGGQFGIVARLETSFVNGSVRGTIRDGFGNNDTVIDIERVAGTRFGDSFSGSRMDNQFEGGEGRDIFFGGAGADQIYFDVWFGPDGPATGIQVNLSLAGGQILNDGFGNVETANSIENIAGTFRADTIIGNALRNDIQGNGGTDTLTGAGGQDTFRFNQSGDIDDADLITDFAAAGAGIDRLAFQTSAFAGMSTTLRLVNGTAAATNAGTFVYDAADDTLYWDRDGTGAAGRVAVAVLTNVAALSASNFDLF